MWTGQWKRVIDITRKRAIRKQWEHKRTRPESYSLPEISVKFIEAKSKHYRSTIQWFITIYISGIIIPYISDLRSCACKVKLVLWQCSCTPTNYIQHHIIQYCTHDELISILLMYAIEQVLIRILVSLELPPKFR